MQKVFISILALGICLLLNIQSITAQNSVERKGLTYGFSVGAGALTLSDMESESTTIAATFPNIRIGYMLNDQLALQFLLPGSPYDNNGKTRGFEGIVLSGQYWFIDKAWILGGMGVALDAPAFWTVTDPSTENFYAGFPALTFATGYELLQGKKFTVDLQYRIFAGQVELENSAKQQGISNMFSVGLNWY